MKKIVLSTSNSSRCEILVGDCRKIVESVVTQADLVVADRAVFQNNPLSAICQQKVELQAGESLKSLAQAQKLYELFFDRGLTRSATIVAVGGGTLCDLLGFVCSTYLRGLNFISLPTSLLAQVDASIGGKNGLNFKGAKNQIGTIVQPQRCICHTPFLETLSQHQLAEGYAEIIKHGIISSLSLFELLENRPDPFSLINIEEIVTQSVLVKKNIVEVDETENGERRKLNFGHTIGHALEILKNISHGHAVSIGMMLELNLSLRRGLVSEATVLRIRELLTRYKLPIAIDFDNSSVASLLSRDKKRQGSIYHLPLITDLGSSAVFEVDESEVLQALESR